MAARIRKGDTVVVIAGRDKGARGEVLRVLPGRDRVVVSGVNMVVRHKKPSQVDPGGLTRMEGAVHISNLAHPDPRDGKVTRIGFRFDDHGRKVRFARRSGEAIDV